MKRARPRHRVALPHARPSPRARPAAHLPHAPPPRPHPATEFRLQTLLHFADSLFSYRTTYHGAFQPASVLTWLFASAENPRGLRWIADRLNEHLLVLPEDLSPRAVAGLGATAVRLVSRVRHLDATALAASARHSPPHFSTKPPASSPSSATASPKSTSSTRRTRSNATRMSVFPLSSRPLVAASVSEWLRSLRVLCVSSVPSVTPLRPALHR